MVVDTGKAIFCGGGWVVTLALGLILTRIAATGRVPFEWGLLRRKLCNDIFVSLDRHLKDSAVESQLAEVLDGNARHPVTELLCHRIGESGVSGCKVLITGAPGAGKSVALKQTARALAADGRSWLPLGMHANRGSLGGRRPIPVLIHLGSVHDADILEVARKWLRAQSQAREILRAELDALLDSGRVVLLLDAFRRSWQWVSGKAPLRFGFASLSGAVFRCSPSRRHGRRLRCRPRLAGCRCWRPSW